MPKITAKFTSGATATGTAQVTVTTPAGTSGAKPFAIYIAPTLTSISPLSGAHGTNVNVTLTGTNFRAPLNCSVTGGGINITNVTVVSPTQVTAIFHITAGAALGNRNVSVNNPGGVSNAVTFIVN